MADATLLAVLAIGSLRGAAALLRARWPLRAPATAILLWQALGLAGGLATVGALLAVGADGAGVAGIGVGEAGTARPGVVGELASLAQRPAGQLAGSREPVLLILVRVGCLLAGIALFAVLCWVLVMAFVTAVQARHRQRELLALLAHGDPKAPGALVVDYPAAAAYCLPGIKSQIVVSAGTLDLLAPAELAAVLAHERAHVRARHDLVLIPFTSLRRAFPRSRVIRQAQGTVALLVEMMADDRALRVPARGTHAEGRTLLARELATALLRFGTASSGNAPAPAGALAIAAEGDLTARVNRLLAPPRPLSRAVRATVVLGAALLVVLPFLLLTAP
ncbi:MAG: M56 family metallopeptidase [Nocardiopsaceae bacterium]|nr:M56 family metallopeptidase [Nocardiopsaceae bacterium]